MVVVVVEEVVVVLVVVVDVVVNMSGIQNPIKDPADPPGPVIVNLLNGEGATIVRFIPRLSIIPVQVAVFPLIVYPHDLLLVSDGLPALVVNVKDSP